MTFHEVIVFEIRLTNSTRTNLLYKFKYLFLIKVLSLKQNFQIKKLFIRSILILKDIS